jgi:hypothetical protein
MVLSLLFYVAVTEYYRVVINNKQKPIWLLVLNIKCPWDKVSSLKTKSQLTFWGTNVNYCKLPCAWWVTFPALLPRILILNGLTISTNVLVFIILRVSSTYGKYSFTFKIKSHTFWQCIILSPHALWEKLYVFTESHDKYTSICASVNLVHVLLFNSSCNLYYSTFKFIEFFTIVQICHWGILIEHFISLYESYFQNFHLVLSCISIFLPILYRMSHFHLSPH